MLVSEVALILFVPFTIFVFQTVERTKAVIIALMAGALFLPERIMFDFPLLPPLHKGSITALTVFAMLLFSGRTRSGPGGPFMPAMLALAGVSAIGTFLTNRDPLPVGARAIPGLESGDVISALSYSILEVALPFWIGKTVFASRHGVSTFIKFFAGFGIVYGFLMLVEIRLSPQLHAWVYGFHQHSFAQAIRSGGYRPLVFMAHGLAATLYCSTAIIACVTLSNAGEKIRGISPLYPGLFLLGVLALSNSMGSLIYAVMMTPLIWLDRSKLVVFVASAMALFVFFVPVLRTFGLLPLDAVIDFFVGIDPDRAGSLAFRFANEEMLIQKAIPRYAFGWGGFGRSRVFDERGEDISVTDSAWIIMFGTGGAVLFLYFFLFLLKPIWMAREHVGALPDKRERALLAGIVMMLTIYTFDLLLNGFFNYFPVLIAGVVYGYCGDLKRRRLYGYQEIPPASY